MAGGLLTLATGGDGGGSIRIPAACNGLVGLKPTRGRLPLETAHDEMPIKLVANGVVTRSVRDTAAFFREAEKAWRSPKLPAIGDVTGPGARRLRIGVLTRSIRRESSPEVRAATLETAALLEALGHHVETIDEMPVPDSFVDDFLLYWALLAMALVRGGQRRFGPSCDPQRLDNLTLGLNRRATRNLHRMPAALTRLATTRRRTRSLTQRFDVVLTPTLADETPPVGHIDPMADYDQIVARLIDWAAFTPLQNVTGDPAISLPLAHSSTGLPIGMMFNAPAGHEARLLELAYELEAARPFRGIAG